MVRGFARHRTNELGNFWVDLTRGTLRILLPISIIAAIVLIAGGAIQNFHLNDQVVNTLAGAQQTITGGPVASQEAIKSSAPTAAASTTPTPRTHSRTRRVDELDGDLPAAGISFSLPRTFGRMVGSNKQGYAIAAVDGVLALLSVSFMMLFQLQHHGTVPTAVGRGDGRASNSASALPTRRSSPTRPR